MYPQQDKTFPDTGCTATNTSHHFCKNTIPDGSTISKVHSNPLLHSVDGNKSSKNSRHNNCPHLQQTGELCVDLYIMLLVCRSVVSLLSCEVIPVCSLVVEAHCVSYLYTSFMRFVKMANSEY
jgi:hypothetical protein